MTELTLEHVAHLPPPGVVIPAMARFSPDGRVLTYLHGDEGSFVRVLWSYDLATGEKRVLFSPERTATEGNLSAEEKLMRERQRIMATGVTTYEWAQDVPIMLVPLLGDLWIIDGDEATKVGGGALDPRISPDGTRVAFVRDGDVWCLDIATREERRLTVAREPGVTNGLAEYVAQEEMDRYRGFWWSDDSATIAFEEVDERHIPVFRIPHWAADTPSEEEHRYPFAGGENARIRLGVVPATGGDVTWLDLGDWEYLTRVDWHPDGRVFAQVMNRDQTQAELRAYDRTTGAHVTLIEESSEVWVNLHNDLRFIEDTGEFIWASERTGLKQLYLSAPDGSLTRQITDAAFPVSAVLRVDGDSRRVAYAASENPTQMHIRVASIDGGAPERLTEGGGMHGASFAPDLKTWVHVAHSPTEAPSVRIRGAREDVLHEPTPLEIDLPVPELFTFENRDGLTLHGVLYRPAVTPAPLIVDVYGGPHAQFVTDGWGARISLSKQYLAKRGFAVISVDNRGSEGRGLAFEGAILERMGTVEVDDQVDAVAHAVAQGWADEKRVGITGWSYGGYMTLMCMLRRPDVFHVGVAGAPVTHWDGYDTFYTERYMRRPQDNPHGYTDGSPLTHAADLDGELLLIHGMIDENVHFRHTARFLDALQKAGKSCDLMAYPAERHSPRSEPDRRTMHAKIVDYFERHLGLQGAPQAGSATGT